MPDKTETERYLEAAGFTGLEPATPNPPAQSSDQPLDGENSTSDIDKFLADFGLPAASKGEQPGPKG